MTGTEERSEIGGKKRALRKGVSGTAGRPEKAEEAVLRRGT